jgi:toxin-antitoxin system PIN domain toxin
MTDLPDVNVWLALADADHKHHAVAKAYWLRLDATPVAFCRVSMLGFLRLSTQPKVLSFRPSIQEAWNLYRQYLSDPHVVFLNEPPDFEAFMEKLTSTPGFVHRLSTDAYLAALAIASGCRLVSLDSDFQTFDGLHFLHLKPS